MGEVIQVEALEWQPVRPEITRGVSGKTLLAESVKAVLTRVAPGGKFSLHKDSYGHLFYFLSGTGTVQVDQARFEVKSGLAVRISPGESHSYENTGADDLVLLSLNLPAS